MFIHLADKEGNIIYSNLENEQGHLESLKKCSVQNEIFIIKNKKFRHGVLKNNDGVVYIITNDKEIIERPRFFKESLKVYLQLIPFIKKIEKSIRDKTDTHTRRLLHNLSSLNGHNIQEMFSLITEEELREIKNNRKSFIKQRINQRIDDAAEVFSHVIKNNASIKMEFSVSEKLRERNPKIKKQRHEVRKALMNIIHIFFPDFTDLNIRVNVEDSNTEIYLDFESFQVAIYHLMDNAIKYAMKDSDININFSKDDKNFNIEISMISLQIKHDEIYKITQEYFCGENAKKIRKNGQGIGLFLVKKVLHLNEALFEIHSNVDKTQITRGGIDYEKNLFIIKFPQKLLLK